MAELLGLKKQRSVNKGKLTFILNSVKKSTDMSIEECKAKLHRIEKLMDEFTVIENNIFSLDPAQDPDMEYEENYYKAITELNKLIRKIGVDTGNTSFDNQLNTTHSGADVGLPKLNIPTFSGDYTEWQSFYDLYVSSIHDSTSLSPVQKFQYLKGLLRGEAASLLRHFSITEANYIEALQKLRQRYDRKRYTMNAFIRTFIEQPSINTANNSNIKRLLDTSDEVLRGLKAMGPHGEDRDPWLLYILVNKLDDESKSLWAQETAINDFPAIKDLFEFLLRRSDALESVRCSNKRSVNSTNKPQPIKTHITTQDVKCPICKSDGHFIYYCPEFNGMNVQKRRELIQSTKRCFNCLSDKHAIFKCLSRRRCPLCKGKHHTLLHLAEEEAASSESKEELVSSTSNSSLTHHCRLNTIQSILPTALVQVICSTGQTMPCRALLDSGSQTSFMTESCLQRLGIPRKNGRVTVKGLGQVEAGVTKGAATIQVETRSGSVLTINVLILKSITKLPQMSISASSLKNWETLPLADPDFYKANEIDVLIGIDHFFNILIEGQIKSDKNEPVLQNTVFGWIVAGTHVQQNPNKYDSILGFTTNIDENNIDSTLKRFWELESIPNDVSLLSPDEELCEASFAENLQRTSDGRFQVRLPFKKSTTELGQSLTMAIQRLKGMERRFARDDEFYILYKEFMTEYLALGHMKEIPQPSVKEASFFLPHHGVIKKDRASTKIRVVFDGSAKTTSGVSLNDCLAVGPTVQSTLYAIILRFREHRYIFSADIEKMYRQVRVHEDDTKFQQIVWREDPTHPIRYFKLTTVTYGLASAPYLATRCVKQIAQTILSSHPAAAKTIDRDIYVDDLMTGADTLDETKNLKKFITTSLSTYGFNLRKWVSNSSEVLNDILPADRGHQIKPIDDVSDKTVKILGLQYDPLDDLFKFRVELPSNLQFTKRTILSEAGKIFDPLGWIAPINIKIKIFIQQLWLLNLNWDDQLPEKEIDEWRRIRSTLPDIQEIKIPRFVHTNKNSSTELHGFCDASQMAYAAVIYYRVTTEDGDSYIHLITAKTKVAPIKQQSLPRLELCGAILLTNLMNLVRKETNTNVETIFLWTDSTIVLDWLTSHPRRWPTFIANRTSQIISSFNRTHWRHVPSADNPADIASRGCFPHELKDSILWWNGPDWLHGNPSVWPPQQRYYENLEDGCLNSISHAAVMENDILDKLITSCSTFHKIQRVVAYILRFINNCKKESFRNVDFFLSGKEMFDALFKLCGYDQSKYFQNELADLRHAKPIRKTSPLKSLNPFVDEFGLLRVGGRLEKCDVPFSTRHPIILSAKSLLTTLLLNDMHREHKHAGPSLLLAILRQNYWVTGARNLIRRVVHQCVTCTRHKATCEKQLMGNLPNFRLELIRPFHKVGIDYAGPLNIHLTRGRGQRIHKAYICLFICLSTKAVHIELASDLSSEAFLAALKRFVARRGYCHDIYSNNGSNFVGAENQLRKTFKNCIDQSNEVSHFISRHAINWHFIPPSAPHFGGIWESAIKSTKFHLRRVIGDSVLTMEEMNTLLTEIESILNSRPLCVLSSEEIDALTPSHFLIGQSATKLPEYNVMDLKTSHLSRWQMVQYMHQHFWKRWHLEYLTSLQQRSKWIQPKTSLKLNDIVIIKEENVPVNQWLLGKIIKLHSGTDGFVRVVTVKTKTTELKRPISKLVRLPIEPDGSTPAECLQPSTSSTSKA